MTSEAQPGQEQMTDSAPITREEMIEMFGSEMPIEAVNLVWNSDGEKTCGELRAELRAIAAARPTADLGEDGDLVERLRNYHTGASWAAKPNAVMDSLGEAADRIDLLRKALESVRIGLGVILDFESRPANDGLSRAIGEATNVIDRALSRSGG